MLSVDELLPQYPENQRTFREFILREYLQYKIFRSYLHNQNTPVNYVFSVVLACE
ncbi:MAG: hypothetical protein WDN75_13605 [Bacteroidota bacterium]